MTSSKWRQDELCCGGPEVPGSMILLWQAEDNPFPSHQRQSIQGDHRPAITNNRTPTILLECVCFSILSLWIDWLVKVNQINLVSKLQERTCLLFSCSSSQLPRSNLKWCTLQTLSTPSELVSIRLEYIHYCQATNYIPILNSITVLNSVLLQLGLLGYYCCVLLTWV